MNKRIIILFEVLKYDDINADDDDDDDDDDDAGDDDDDNDVDDVE